MFFERLALGLADADDVPKLAHHVEGAIEHGRAERVDGEIDAAAAGEFKHGLLEILVAGDDHPLGAILQRAFLLARRTDGPTTRAPALTANCVVNSPTPPPIALISTVSPGSIP